ncbi:MAG: thermonuclease family protein [Oligoflexia bacterium]|nr:thermonuclease family protein [Oligoflexia bacterium]
MKARHAVITVNVLILIFPSIILLSLFTSEVFKHYCSYFLSLDRGRLVVFCNRVLDGDTIIFDKYQYGRLAYIDAPELKQKSIDNVAIGRESYEYLRSIIEKQTIEIKIIDKDKYGRSIVRIWKHNDDNNKDNNNEEMNLKMIKEGHAILYNFALFESIEEKIKYVNCFYDAILNRRGIWSTEGLLLPYKFRKNKKILNIKY